MYRKLDQNEVESILQRLLSKKKSKEYPQLFKLVKQYFVDVAHYAVISFESEYNDEGYDNRYKSISVYDKNDNLVPIKRNKYEEFNEKVSNLNFGEGTSDNSLEDIVVYFDFTIPDLYVSE